MSPRLEVSNWALRVGCLGRSEALDMELMPYSTPSLQSDWPMAAMSHVPEPARSRGNRLLVLETPQGLGALKVYRNRRGPVREMLSQLSHQAFEGKRDPSARGRWHTEQLSLELWSRHGFRVPRILETPIPSQFEADPATWLEFFPGRPLFWHVGDETVDWDEKVRLVQTLAANDRRRHALAIELREPLLLHEHATTKHVLVHQGELCTIDLEGGFLPGACCQSVAGAEVAGTIRSLWRDPQTSPLSEALPREYVRGYGDVDQLRQLASSASSGLGASLRAWRDRRRRARPKSVVLDALVSLDS